MEIKNGQRLALFCHIFWNQEHRNILHFYMTTVKFMWKLQHDLFLNFLFGFFFIPVQNIKKNFFARFTISFNVLLCLRMFCVYMAIVFFHSFFFTCVWPISINQMNSMMIGTIPVNKQKKIIILWLMFIIYHYSKQTKKK